MAYKRIGDLLEGMGLITPEQLSQALAEQKKTKTRLGQTLIDMGFLTEQQMISALEVQLGVDYIDLSRYIIPVEMAQVVPKSIARKHTVVPVRVERDTLYLAMSDPLNFPAIEEVKSASKKRVVPMVATRRGVEHAIETLYGSEGAVKAMEEMRREVRTDSEETYRVTDIDDESKSAPTVRFVNSIISRAVHERASDIHLEPYADELRVRMRIDGVMRNIMTVPKELQASVVSRLKVMGGMDISERKIPQDGRANVSVQRKEVDLRMSTLPTIHGEKLVIRVLDKDMGKRSKEELGITGLELKLYNELLRSRSGVVLIVGPTGSGKSSTMYAMLRELNVPEVNIITLEDPVEYHLEGISQVQINEKTGMVFASGLRAILRQDPDVIGVGEIRDGETASIAMRAAITGHLVISTIHTSSAAAAIDRLIDIGVEPFLIAGAIRGIVSQRLVRRICPHCRRAYTATVEEKELLGMNPDEEYTFYKGEGCPECFHTGYRGRIGVYEILPFDRKLRLAITTGRDRQSIQDMLAKADFVSLPDNCRRLVREGVTSAAEAVNIIHSADL